jgi:Transglycosylase SLT domain
VGTPRAPSDWPPPRPVARNPGRGRSARRIWLALAAALLIVAIAVVAVILSRGSTVPALPAPTVAQPRGPGELFTYIPARAGAYAARATAGNAHVLFIKSPGGVPATAARVAAFRRTIDAVTAGTSIDPNLLEGLVFLESAGDPGAIAGGSPAAASGLTQILPQTATELLGMHVELAQSERLTGAIDVAEAQGKAAVATRLEAERARVDDRFNPRKALAGTVRYLELSERRFGRADLAIESYNMGIGNLGQVLDAYDGGRSVPYVQLFFDTSPDHHAAAYRLLSGFSNDSWLYYWRVLGAAQIMRLYRTDRAALVRLNDLQTATDSAAQVLHPPNLTASFPDPDALDRGYASHVVVPLPSNPVALGLAYSPEMGSLAHQLGVKAALYRGLRPEALELLLQLAGRVRRLAAGAAPLIVTSTVEDGHYQQTLGLTDPPAAAGWSFTIDRRYVSGAQAGAFQAVLDRLQSLNLIAWQRFTEVIEVTAASDTAAVIAHGP